MGLLGQISYYMNMVFVCIIFAFGITAAVLWYLFKVKKMAAKVENINTSYFKKEDSISYVPVRDVLYNDGLDSDGILALSDTEFVAGISVRGFDYASASNAERVSAQVGAVNFFNIVDEPISFRQSVKAIDLSVNIEEYEEVRRGIASSLMSLDAEYETTLGAAQDYIEDYDVYQGYAERLKELKRIISAKNHMLDECDSVIAYMKAMSGDVSRAGGGKNGQRTSQILFSYTYNPDEYSEELTGEEIFIKAQEALRAKARSYMDALSYCQFRAKRLSCRELIALIRKHNFPLTGEDARIEELLDSSYTSLFVSSDSLMEAQRKRVGDEEYDRRIAQYELELEQALQAQKESLDESAERIAEDSYLQAREELLGRKG